MQVPSSGERVTAWLSPEFRLISQAPPGWAGDRIISNKLASSIIALITQDAARYRG